MNRAVCLIPVIVLSISACTSIEVTHLRQGEIREICIRKNPQSRKPLEDTIAASFARYGVQSRVVSSDTPEDCTNILTYSAYWSWDVVPYMRAMDMSIWNYEKVIAKANFHMRGGGGFAVTKWKKAETKIDEMVDKMFGVTTTSSDDD
ncbi:MAG: Sbal_3080 family lipoprotein [Betaproteobacteria bacterium]|nr:Sbal_3080 family lipoprotein [Betaproteobacteria bacterium]